MAVNDQSAAPRPGWYARLEGEDVDLDDWLQSFNEPFDPVALKLPNGEIVLRSADFDDLTEASDVRARALILVSRMNGAISLWNGAQPVRFAGVYRIDESGKQHAFIFAEMAAMEFGRCIMRATAVVLGPDGKPISPPPPEPSAPQKWNRLAEKNDDVSDLLDHLGRANNWYDIYKTIELAAHLVGSKHRLWRLADTQALTLKNLDRTANFYRHARGATRPAHPFTLNEARPLLAWMVRTVLDRALESSAAPDRESEPTL